VIFWAKVGFIVALLTLATLPFDPLLNQRYLVLPLCVLCVIVGIVSMYICTLPEKSRGPRSGGAS
jgi:Na+/glutamate symporter